MKNWHVIANAARAHVLEATDTLGACAHVADLVHPQSRQKDEALASERRGHVEGIGHGLGSASYQPQTDPRERERDRSAREVARWLNQGVARHDRAGLVLVASSPFLGQLKAQLVAQAHKAIVRTLDGRQRPAQHRPCARNGLRQTGC